MIQTGILKLKRKTGITRHQKIFHAKPLILWAGLVGLIYLFIVQNTGYGKISVREVHNGYHLREDLESEEIQYEGIVNHWNRVYRTYSIAFSCMQLLLRLFLLPKI